MKYSEGYKYVTRSDGCYQCKFIAPGRFIILRTYSGRILATLSETGLLVWGEFYAWNGANFPAPELKSSRRGTLVHDILYQMMRLGLIDRLIWWHPANKELQNCMIEDGAFKATAYLYFKGVETKIAYKSTLPEGDYKILTAP